jgi:hypothetical protein
VRKTKEDGPRVLGLCLSVGGVEGFLGEAVDLAAKVKDGAIPLLGAHLPRGV